MVINAARVFACSHEFVAMPGFFVCHKCEHTRIDLPYCKDNRQSILLFPMQTQEKKAV